MARRTETVLYSGHMIWWLEHCESVILIDAWLRVKGRIPPTENWTFDFEHRFFERGDAVSDRHLASINRHLRRIGANEVRFDETNVSEYVRLGDKATWLKDRLHIKEVLESMDAATRCGFVEKASASADALEPSHRVYEEWRDAKKPNPMPQCKPLKPVSSVPPRPLLPQVLVETSQTAGSSPSPTEMPKMSPEIEIAFKLLEQTTDAEMKNQLVRVIATAYGLTSHAAAAATR